MPIPLLMVAATLTLPAPIHGDFDHDGMQDTTQIVSSPTGGYALVIRRGIAGHPVTVITHIKAKDVSSIFIDTEKIGRWKTWCGKGGGIDTAPCPRKYVNLRGGELTFGSQDASESVVLWTGKNFEAVLLSD